jgi:hypothetical protein
MKYVMGAFLLALASAAQAAGIGVRAGTTGVGADFGWGVMPTLGARVGFSGMKFDADVDSDNVNYDADVKLANLNALLDWSPLGPFRITAGLIANSNKLDVIGRPRSGSSFPQDSTLTGTVKSGRSLAPYLGVGYGNVWTKGVNFYVDLGVMFQGTPKVDLNATCGASLTPAQCAQAQSEVEAEERRVRDDVKSFRYYPVLNLGITVGF